jgi:single-stranded-DNA-specific exonuclease
MEKKWVLKPLPDVTQVQQLAASLNISQSLSALLMQRGVSSFESARHFFRPDFGHLYDPFLMKDMDKAVWRIEEAIRNREKILIYGDYDVDGTTAVALVAGYLRHYYPNIEYYTPDRYTEGYGISQIGIDRAKDEGVSLIVSLDCGIKAVKQVSYANELGIDFIICDHHLPGASLPTAFAVLDPKRVDCEYPYKELSGCGVGFKLMQAFAISNQLPQERLFEYLDLLAVSIAADIVPITDENRVLAYFGLKKLNSNPRPGLKALIEVAALRSEIEISNIVFGIAPRINAVGRIAHARKAIELLLTDSAEEAAALALIANDNNEQRRDFDASITQEALAMIESETLSDSPCTVLFKNDWHKGVIGIVAARCIEKYYRPTIILTEANDKATGSARSVIGFDIYEAIAECADLLDQYGGHKYAAGLTLPLENIEAFKEKFIQVTKATINKEDLIPQIEADQELQLSQINFKFYNIIRQMAPFGPSNMQPVFVSRSVVLESPPRVLKDIHLKLVIKQEGSYPIDAIGFNMADLLDVANTGEPFDICYNISENDYKGRKSLQLLIRDIKPAAWNNSTETIAENTSMSQDTVVS